MTDKTKILIEEARKLSSEERIELVEAVMTSLDEPDTHIEAAWATEVEDRITAHERGEMPARSAAAVLAKYGDK
jgi:putative addiction module component (TIGR02574 family)